MIESSLHGRVAVLTLAHGKANALDLELCGEIVRRFAELRTSSAQAVVLTGTGRIFSAGVNLIRLLDGGKAYVQEFLPVLEQAFRTVFFCPKPVVAAVNGHAIAGGCVLACAADRRLMARNAGRIGVTELLVGVPFPPMAFEIMRFAAAPRHLHEIIFAGATYPPEHATGYGLIDDIADPPQLLDRALAAAEELVALSPAAFALMKQQVRQPVQDHLDRHGDAFNQAANDIWTKPEAAARIRDYVSRTFKKT
jgi:enoyl-CoA hydratase/carnithine racemase